jgi:hypothetical protein
LEAALTMRFISQVIYDWGCRCFGIEHMQNRQVRAVRLLEEAIELCQAVSVSENQVVQVVDVVYRRPPGSERQELGGVLLTAHALAVARGWDPEHVLEDEVHRCLSKPPEHFAARNQEKLDLGLTG